MRQWKKVPMLLLQRTYGTGRLLLQRPVVVVVVVVVVLAFTHRWHQPTNQPTNAIPSVWAIHYEQPSFSSLPVPLNSVMFWPSVIRYKYGHGVHTP